MNSPVFRKTIVPWYDTHTAGVALFMVMLAVLLFGIEGVRVAGRSAQYNGYAWVPLLLIILSGGVCVSILFRLLKRYWDRDAKPV